MKKSILLSLILTAIISTQLLAQRSGELDPTFGIGGKDTAIIGYNGNQLNSIALQKDGKIVAGGFSINQAGRFNFSLIRFIANGRLDSTFGTGGKVISVISPKDAQINAVAIQSDGKILATGSAINGNKTDFAVARYLTNGLPDSSFGVAGKVFTPMGSYNDWSRAILIQPDGKIILAGGSDTSVSNSHFALARYNANGNLDSSFGINGKVFTAIDTTDQISSIALQPDGKIIAGGYCSNGVKDFFALTRYNLNGSIDSSFNLNGIIISGLGDAVNSVLVQPDGKILSAGDGSGNGGGNFSLVRFNADGSLDNSFGIGGHDTTSFGTFQFAALYSMILQADGKIVAGGYATNTTIYHFALSRYMPNGMLDTSFGSGGRLITVFNAKDGIGSMALQPDGKIVAGGFSINAGVDAFALARYLPGLALGVLDFKTYKNAIFIYPNPVTDNAELRYTLQKEENISIQLMDMEGRTITAFIQNQNQQPGEHTQSIDFPQGLASGAYLIVVSSPEGMESLKIIK